MERKIGETFELEGTTLRVTEIKEHTCKGCYLMEECYREKREVTGECFDRTDKKNVIFTEVEEVTEQQDEPTEQPKQELNLLEILKNCPKGEKFWSPALGIVEFQYIKNESVKVYVPFREYYGFFTTDGKFDFGVNLKSEECMLFPSREQREWSKVHFETPVEKLPKSWQEFCETHEVQKGEAYIKDISTVYKAENTGDTRDMNADKNILPNEMACYQHLALMQLHQLRDCWRDGWKPEPNKTRWGITKDGRGDIELNSFDTVSVFLSFQDEERAELFVKHFRNIIMAAGDLI